MMLTNSSKPINMVTRALYYVICGAVLAFLVVPVFAIVPLSFSSEPWFKYPLPGISLRWYEELLSSERWRLSFTNSLIVATASTVLATFLGTMAALGMSGKRLRFHNALVGLILAPMVMPLVISAVALFFAFSTIGLNNSYTAMVIAHTILSSPFVFLIVSAALANFDYTLLRAGASLGASKLMIFRTVTLPLIAPGVGAGALFAFITSWDEVIVVLFLGGPEHRTLPRQMFSGIREEISPTITAIATLLIAVAIVSMIIRKLIQVKK